MRVIAGRYADTPLTSPSGRVRPTAEVVRDAWMKELGDALKGSRIVDLFAGSGSVGIEALSRGARYADFVENQPEALHALKANIAKIRASGDARVFKQDAIIFAERLPAARYDIAFADPPYGSLKADRIIEYWLETPFSNILCVEHALDHELPKGGQKRRFGDQAVTFYRVKKAKTKPFTRSKPPAKSKRDAPNDVA
jgi:16S rRNA (guanine966-N2)-methyltransferase